MGKLEGTEMSFKFRDGKHILSFMPCLHWCLSRALCEEASRLREPELISYICLWCRKDKQLYTLAILDLVQALDFEGGRTETK